MAQFSKDTFRGILIPDERINAASISAADSSYSQAGPLPGVPEQPINSYGSQPSAGAILIAVVLHSGGAMKATQIGAVGFSQMQSHLGR